MRRTFHSLSTDSAPGRQAPSPHRAAWSAPLPARSPRRPWTAQTLPSWAHTLERGEPPPNDGRWAGEGSRQRWILNSSAVTRLDPKPPPPLAGEPAVLPRAAGKAAALDPSAPQACWRAHTSPPSSSSPTPSPTSSTSSRPISHSALSRPFAVGKCLLPDTGSPTRRVLSVRVVPSDTTRRSLAARAAQENQVRPCCVSVRLDTRAVESCGVMGRGREL